MAQDFVVKREQLIESAANKLESMIKKQLNAMPQGFNQTRFLQNCITVLRETRDIEKCTAESIALTLIQGAYLDLDFFRRECYAIPYAGKLQFQTDYKGEIKLVKKHGTRKIKHIYAKVVREGDALDIKILEGKPELNFKPMPFNDKPLLGAFAVVVFDDGSLEYDTMSTKEMEATRKNYSKCPDSPAWKKSPEEMYKKTVMRRLCKMIDLEFDNQDQQRAYEEGAGIHLEKQLDPNTTESKVNKDPFESRDSEISDAELLKQEWAPEDDPPAAVMSPQRKKRFDDMKASNKHLQDWQIEALLDEEDHAA